MDRKSSACPISSTPHPRRNPLLCDIFDNDTLSPIQISQPEDSTKPSQLRAKSVRAVKRVHAAIPKKRRCDVKDKVAESASSAVLQEFGVTAESLRKNVLSQSRNMYNMYPEPVILDSDEEEEFLESRTSHKVSPEKKGKRVNKTSPKMKKVESKVKDCKKPDSGNKTDEEDEVALQLRTGYKDTPKKKDRGTSARVKKANIKEKNEEEADENPKPGRSRKVKSGQPRLPSALAERAASKQQPLDNLANIQAAETATKPRNKMQTKPTVDPQEKLDNDDSLFPEYHLLSKSKRKFCNTPSVRDSIDMDAIKWTPRVAKNVKSKVSSRASTEDCDNEESDHEESKDENPDTSNPICSVKPSTRQHSKENISSDGNCQLNNNKRHPTESCFPKECLSRFEDVVFRHNKHSGGIVANCLQTDTVNLGYVEVKKGEVFSVQRSQCTLVLIQGQVEVKVEGATQTLSLGDMLHIPAGSLYQFHNSGTQNARFIYVKENQ